MLLVWGSEPQLRKPVVEAELWKLATEWKLKPVGVLTGTLWERA